ncbi:MAG TPA: substrate-binding domain-containing protein, partial [Acidimicrobiales bacterium]|nr:substrate-binding domain-containing protein [Acidimicrobiales bacterium]
MTGALATMVFAVLSTLIFEVSAVGATSYVPVYGEGSSWSANAINQWISDVQQSGMRVQYTANGSTAGRQDYILGKTDFAASDIPFQTNPGDGTAAETP